MRTPKEPKPVKLIAGLIFNQNDILFSTQDKLTQLFGEIDFESEIFPFDFTDYYENEMGKKLKRKFISFRTLIPADSLPQIKLKTIEIEKEFCHTETTNRAINIDPGYLSLEKLVLASSKNFSHRPYLFSGIFAELTYFYKNESYRPLDWTYPDYKIPERIEMFNKLRAKYGDQL